MQRRLHPLLRTIQNALLVDRARRLMCGACNWCLLLCLDCPPDGLCFLRCLVWCTRCAWSDTHISLTPGLVSRSQTYCNGCCACSFRCIIHAQCIALVPISVSSVTASASFVRAVCCTLAHVRCSVSYCMQGALCCHVCGVQPCAYSEVGAAPTHPKITDCHKAD